MRALLRADWLRIRRRRDLWLISIAVCVVAAVSFLNGYKTDVSDPFVDDPAALRAVMAIGFSSSGMTQADIDAQLDLMVSSQIDQEKAQVADANERQKTTLQQYAFPQSLFTILGSGVVPLLALVLIGGILVGDEFRFGTIRTSLLAASNRRRFLAARMLSLLAMIAAVHVTVAVTGAVLGIVLGLVGAELAPTTVPIDGLSSVVWLVGQILVTFVVVALGTVLTLALRSGALPLLLVLLGAFVELFVVNLPTFAEGQLLAGVPQAFLGVNIRTLTYWLGQATHAVALSGGSPPVQAIAVPVIGVAAVVVAWGALFLALADRRLRTMDVVE